METYILLKNLLNKRAGQAIAYNKHDWLHRLNSNLYPDPEAHDPWEYHIDYGFNYRRESVAYNSSGVQYAADTPVFEDGLRTVEETRNLLTADQSNMVGGWDDASGHDPKRHTWSYSENIGIFEVTGELSEYITVHVAKFSDLEELRGKKVTLTADIEVSGLSSGGIRSRIRDVRDSDDSTEDVFSPDITTNGKHRLKLTKNIRDVTLSLVRFNILVHASAGYPNNGAIFKFKLAQVEIKPYNTPWQLGQSPRTPSRVTRLLDLCPPTIGMGVSAVMEHDSDPDPDPDPGDPDDPDPPGDGDPIPPGGPGGPGDSDPIPPGSPPPPPPDPDPPNGGGGGMTRTWLRQGGYHLYSVIEDDGGTKKEKVCFSNGIETAISDYYEYVEGNKIHRYGQRKNGELTVGARVESASPVISAPVACDHIDSGGLLYLGGQVIALYHDGVDDKIDLTTPLTRSDGQESTVEFCVSNLPKSGTYSVIGNSSTLRPIIEFGTSDRLFFLDSDSATVSSDLIGSYIGMPYTRFSVVIKDGATKTVTMYQNGVSLGSFTIGTTAINFGRLGLSGSNINPLHGNLSDVRFWNVARTEEQINANLFKRLKGDEPDLQLYLPMDEAEGTTAFDLTTNNNHGNINGATWTAIDPVNADVYNVVHHEGASVDINQYFQGVV